MSKTIAKNETQLMDKLVSLAKCGLLICVLSMSMISCRDNPTSTGTPYQPPNDLRKVIPLAVGNTWIYRRIGFDWDGTATDTTYDSTMITDTIRLDGKLCFRYQGFAPHPLFMAESNYLESVDSNDYSFYYCLNCTSNVYNENSTRKVLGWVPMHILKSPLVTGNQWYIAPWDSIEDEDDRFGRFQIVDANATVETPGGVFEHAIHIFGIYDVGEPVSVGRTMTIVPGVGVVQSSEATSMAGGDIVELVRWRLN